MYLLIIMLILLFILILLVCLKRNKNKHIKIEGNIKTPIISGEIKLDIDNSK